MPFPFFIIMVTIVTLPNDQKFDCAIFVYGRKPGEVIFATKPPKKKAKKVVKLLRSFAVHIFFSKSFFFFRTNYPTEGSVTIHPFHVLKNTLVLNIHFINVTIID